METRLEQQLEAIKAELKKQDEEWRRAKEALAALGDVQIAVAREALERLETRSPAAPTPRAAFNGVRA